MIEFLIGLSIFVVLSAAYGYCVFWFGRKRNKECFDCKLRHAQESSFPPDAFGRILPNGRSECTDCDLGLRHYHDGKLHYYD